MSLHSDLWEEAKQDFRRMEGEMQRQMRLMERYLQQFQEDLPASHTQSPAPRHCCLCQCELCPCERGILSTGLSVQRELSRLQRTLDHALNSSHDQKLLTSMDLEGFDPKEITVTVKDGKVKVLAEHEEERAITNGKEYNYRKMMKEITLPPGVSEDEVTYSLGCNSVVEIKTAHKHCP